MIDSHVPCQGILDHTEDDFSRFLDGILESTRGSTRSARVLPGIRKSRIANALHATTTAATAVGLVVVVTMAAAPPVML
jgi:hypothetical protein